MIQDVRIRSIEESDYDAIISVLDECGGERQMVAMLPRLFFKYFNQTSFLAEIGDKRVAFLVGFFSATGNSEAYIHFAGVQFQDRGTITPCWLLFSELRNAAACRTES